jgi:hypothetical protein
VWLVFGIPLLALRGWLFTCSWGAALLTAFERGLVVVMIIARGQ